jgi:hypothetical protein
MKKKIVLAIVGVVVVLVVAAFVLVNPQKLVAAKKDEILAKVSQKIGRQITAGDVTASVGAELKARISDVKVAGAAGAKPQVELGALDVRFSLLHALLTFGRDLTVEKFTVTNLTIRAARDADGKWDFEDVLDKLNAPSSPAAPPAASATPASDSSSSVLDDVRIASVSVKDARIELDDKTLGRPLAVSALDIDTSDVEIKKPLDVHLTATLEDGAKMSPIDVFAKLAQLPPGLSFDPMPDANVKVKLTGVDLAPWGGLLPKDATAPAAGSLTVDVTANGSDDLAHFVVDGTIGAKGLVVRDGSGERGAPLDADVAVSLDVDQKKPHYLVKKLTLKGDGLDVDATVDASAASLAGLDKADVKASAQDLGKLLAVLPPSLRGVPEELKLEGPLDAKLSSSGSEITAGVNLDKMHVQYADDFDKAAGKSLHLDLHGKRSASSLDVDNFALVVDSAKIGGTMSLPTAKDAPFSADIKSGPIEIASLRALAPPFQEAIGKGKKVDGVVEVKVAASNAGGRQKADADVELRSLDVNLANTVVHGGGVIGIKAEPSADDVHVTVDADLGGLSVKKGDSLNKPAGLPLKLAVDAKKSKTAVNIASLALDIGKSAIRGHGTIADFDKKEPKLDVDFGDLAVNFDDVRAAVPGAARLPAGGRLRAKLKAAGSTSTDKLVVDVKDLDLDVGKAKVTGNMHVESLDKPKFAFDLNSDELDVDKLRAAFASDDKNAKPAQPAKEEKAAPDENPHGLSKSTRALLANTNGKGTITAKHAIVKGMPLENFKGILVVKNGKATFDALDFGLYGGTVSAAGTTLDLAAERTGYDLKLKGKEVDFAQFVAAHSSLGKVFTGKLSPDVDIKGKGLAAGDFAITAEGPASLTFDKLALASLDLESAIVEAVNKNAKGKASSTKSGALSLQAFKAATQFVGGKIHLDKPVETDSPIGKITWTGNAGLDAGLDLAANIALAPATIAKMTGNKVKPASAVAVPVKIGGTWDKPRVTGVDVAQLLRSLGAAAAGQAAKDVEKDVEKDVVKDVAKGSAKDVEKDVTKDVLGALGGKSSPPPPPPKKKK